MTAVKRIDPEETKRQKARALRYKKAIVTDMNIVADLCSECEQMMNDLK